MKKTYQQLSTVDAQLLLARASGRGHQAQHHANVNSNTLILACAIFERKGKPASPHLAGQRPATKKHRASLSPLARPAWLSTNCYIGPHRACHCCNISKNCRQSEGMTMLVTQPVPPSSSPSQLHVPAAVYVSGPRARQPAHARSVQSTAPTLVAPPAPVIASNLVMVVKLCALASDLGSFRMIRARVRRKVIRQRHLQLSVSFFLLGLTKK